MRSKAAIKCNMFLFGQGNLIFMKKSPTSCLGCEVVDTFAGSGLHLTILQESLIFVFAFSYLD